MKIKRRKDNYRSAIQAKSDANRERWVRDSSEILRMRDQLIPWVENHQAEAREPAAEKGALAPGEAAVAVHDGRSEPELESGYVVITRRQFAILSAAAPLHLASVKTEADFKKPETYCPWNWTCPHLSTPSELVSIKALKHNYSTPTGTHGPASENPYLARFLQPATRIGDELKIDDAAAASMWNKCVAVNPALTPREFLLIVRMKLQEGGRIDEARP